MTSAHLQKQCCLAEWTLHGLTTVTLDAIGTNVANS